MKTYLLIAIPLVFTQIASAATTSALEWVDKNDFTSKRQAIENLGRRHFGTGVKGTLEDLDLLQRIANRKLIKQDDKDTLQATGVVLGDILQNELGLQWMVYEDSAGRSRALCVPKTEHCLFPITMISRRLEVGTSVDVQQIYRNAVELIDPYLPDDNAYDGVKETPEPKPSFTKDRKEMPRTIPIR